MSMPAFSALASLYRTSNRYHSSIAEFSGSIPDQTVVAAYIPGPETQNKCSGCTDYCLFIRNVCFAKVALSVTEACIESLGFGCGAAIAWGYQAAASCYAYTYLPCLGYCNIPDADIKGTGICCPKVCGFPKPWEGSGSGCCDHGEACVDTDDPNSRGGCCPTDQLVCGGSCCAKGETCCGQTCCPPDHYCLDGNNCSAEPGYFPTTPTPPPPVHHCILGGVPCGTRCCPHGLQCCGIDVGRGGAPICKSSCLA